MYSNTPIINFKPSIKQFKAWEYLTDNETTSIGYGGSAFSGKSYLLCYFLTTMCIAYPDTGWGLGRKELTVLKKTTLLTLFKVFDECGINATHFNYNQQLNIISFYNKSQIFLIDTAWQPTDPLYTRFGGLELTGAAIDESAETQHSAIDVLSTRLGRRNNQKYNIKAKLLETFNPAKNHVYTRFYKPYKDNKEKKGTVFIPALPSDNPSPEVPEYINRILESGSTVTIERLIHGNFEYDDDPSSLITYDKIIDCFTNSFIQPGDKYITADIARFGNDSTVIAVWYGLKAELFQYKKKSIQETADIIKQLQVKYSIPNSQTIADEDGVGGGVVDILKCKGFVNNSRPLINPITMKDENYSNLKSQCYYKLAELINASKVYINCENITIKEQIIQELEQIKQFNMDKDGKKQIMPKDKVKEVIGRSPDFSDTLMMRMYFEYAPKFSPIVG